MAGVRLCPSQHAETVTGRVVSIADGDALTLLDCDRQQHKIQLLGLDAPEDGQTFGERSKASFSGLGL